MKINKVLNTLPSELEADNVYILLKTNDVLECYVTDNAGGVSSDISKNRDVKIQGNLNVQLNQTVNYIITNFDSFTTYVIVPISGTVTVVDDVITYTAPATIQPIGFKINNEVFKLNLIP
jgi:hypothetical protein